MVCARAIAISVPVFHNLMPCAHVCVRARDGKLSSSVSQSNAMRARDGNLRSSVSQSIAMRARDGNLSSSVSQSIAMRARARAMAISVPVFHNLLLCARARWQSQFQCFTI